MTSAIPTRHTRTPAVGDTRAMAQVDRDGDDARPTPPEAMVRRAAPPDDDDAAPTDQTTQTTQTTPTVPAVPTVTPVPTAAPAPASDPVPASDAPTVVVSHRRRPGLWLPLVVFIALLVAGAAVGRFVVPRPAPDRGSEPPGAAGGLTPGASVSGRPGSGLPPLPTPPVRPADALADWAGRVAAAIGVPEVAIQAYGYAQLVMQDADPTCKVGWTTLAGIAEVESFHGQAGGAVLGKNGRSDPVIVGPLLDGQGGRALVRDTDAGAFDGDATYDRSMGPVRLTPQQWRGNASDADGDRIQDPYDIDDASLALARLLCSATDDLSQLPGWNAALRRYHSGDAYARSVFQAADGYGQRTRNIG